MQLLCPSGPWELSATNESIQTMQRLYLDMLSEDSGRRKIRKKQQKVKLSLSIGPLYIRLNPCLLLYQVTQWFWTALLASLHQLPPQPRYADIVFPPPDGTHPLMKYTQRGAGRKPGECQIAVLEVPAYQSRLVQSPRLCFRRVWQMSLVFV